MIIEGEEETGSAGFQEAIKSHSVRFALSQLSCTDDSIHNHPILVNNRRN
jgi:hypothetical protein